jgi:hypothetical protein
VGRREFLGGCVSRVRGSSSGATCCHTPPVLDVSDAALVASTPELAQVVADRIRQIGLDRIFYGSDAAFGTHPDPRGPWAAFRKGIPLSAAEFETIARNVAPYLRESQ